VHTSASSSIQHLRAPSACPPSILETTFSNSRRPGSYYSCRIPKCKQSLFSVAFAPLWGSYLILICFNPCTTQPPQVDILHILLGYDTSTCELLPGTLKYKPPPWTLPAPRHWPYSSCAPALHSKLPFHGLSASSQSPCTSLFSIATIECLRLGTK
jgi:hypothetical protein